MVRRFVGLIKGRGYFGDLWVGVCRLSGLASDQRNALCWASLDRKLYSCILCPWGWSSTASLRGRMARCPGGHLAGLPLKGLRGSGLLCASTLGTSNPSGSNGMGGSLHSPGKKKKLFQGEKLFSEMPRGKKKKSKQCVLKSDSVFTQHLS